MPIPLWDEAILTTGDYPVKPLLQLVESSTGFQFDVTDHLVGFDINATIGSPSIDVGFQLIRGGTGLELGSGALGSLSPYLDPNAYAFPGTGRPAIDPVVEYFLYVSVDPDYSGTGMGLLMQGVIDAADVAPGGGLINLTCRDRSARYQDVTMPGTAIYGVDGGREASLVMGDMLLANGFNPAEIVSLANPDLMVEPYPVGQVTLLEAIRNLARSAGRDVRMFSQGGQWTLTYYEPDRGRALFDRYISPSETIAIRELSWGVADVRNSINVQYALPGTGLPSAIIHAENAASIARYGLRHFEVFLNPLENVRDDVHAQAFADAAIMDCAWPPVSHRIELPFYPKVLLNDLHVYAGRWAENVTELTLAVMGYTHTWRASQSGGPGTARTVVNAGGQARAAIREYRNGRPPKVVVTTTLATTEYAPEGTIVMPTDNLDPP